MPKYLLLKHYRGGPGPHHPFPPMDQWAPEDVEAHRRANSGWGVDRAALAPIRFQAGRSPLERNSL
jgi:hypothetical protein